MNKLLVVMIIGLSAVAHARKPGTVTVKNFSYASANITYYADAQSDLIDAAKEYCLQDKQEVASLAKIDIKVDADFELDPNYGTRAVTEPHSEFSALVTCK